MDKVTNITFTSSLTDLCEVNSSFDSGVLRICYTGKNRNGSYISKETIERNLKTIYNCPVVTNYDRDTDTLGGHDMEVVKDSEGELCLVNLTQPIGVIPESGRTWFEEYTDDEGVTHEYLYADVLLWKRQEAYKKIKSDGVTKHSMEISVTNGHSRDGVYYIDDFEFNAFALIGCEPCFESSALEMFSASDFKKQLSEMMSDLKESFTTVNSSKEDDNTHPQISMEGGEKVLNEKIELATKYEIDVDSLDFSIEDFELEELEEKFKAMKADTKKDDEEDVEEEVVDDEKDDEEKKDDEEEKFALLSNIREEVRRAFEGKMIPAPWDDDDMIPEYWIVDMDIEAKEVYCIDECDHLLYGFSFSIDGDVVIIDFESKKRKKYEIVDFEGVEEQPAPIDPMIALMSEEIKKYQDVEAKYTESENTIKSMQTELDELREFKRSTESAILEAEREEIFSNFEDLVGVEAFEALRNDCDKLDLETIEEKCFAIRGRQGSVQKFSTKEQKTKLPVERTTEVSNEPYGGLFEKYNTAN